jgi:Glycosyl transferase family 2
MTQATAPKALIYMTARDCEMYVAATLASLARQTHDELHVLFIDDASTDATGAIARRHLEDLFPSRHTLVRNDSAWGKARNAHTHLREQAPRADFIAVLDGDDRLVAPDILARMAAEYAAGQDVVWTNFVTDRGGRGGNGPLDPNKPPRGQGWRTSHFFSFRAELLANVDESYFRREDGGWLPAACDFALAYPILDQTRRYRYLAEQAYCYTSSNPRSHHNVDPNATGLSSALQIACAKEVLLKAPLPCTRPPIDAGAPPAPAAALAAPAAAPSTGGTLPAANAWALAAAGRLAAEVPAVLDLVGAVQMPAFDPLQAWALHRLLASMQRAPRVLEIGGGSWAPMLAALVRHAGGAFWSLGLDEARMRQLERQLRGACITEGVSLGLTQAVSGCVFDLPGHFPDLSPLGAEADFDLIFVSVDHAVKDAVSALHALPAVSARLAAERFSFCLQTGSAVLQRSAAETWRRLADDIDYVEAGCAGLGLLVNSR